MDLVDVEDGRNYDISTFFNKNTSLIDNNFFGTAMSVAPMFTLFFDYEIKSRVTKYVKMII